ncbi:unnamed protein product [Pieris macdunnoughi]|uniref:Uncharacterized protein n=1 Tax=Pieris macdunnoughi TaxID=345717 RepID=A0A821W3Y7_9NEOP|nr:unnamed protein product [Pieris macdunnoughi]
MWIWSFKKTMEKDSGYLEKGIENTGHHSKATISHVTELIRGRKVVNKPGAQILVTSQRDNAEDAPEIDVPPTFDDNPEIDFPTMPEVSSPSTFNKSPKSKDNVSAFKYNQPVPSTSGLLTKHQTDSDECAFELFGLQGVGIRSRIFKEP